MRVRDLMETDVLTLECSDSLDLVDDLMTLGRIRHMPILSDGQLVGLVSQRDLFRAAISSVLNLRRSAEREWLAKISVREVMTTHVFTIAPDATMRSAVELMLAKKIGCLPVVEHGKVVGLLGESDCLRHLARLLDIGEARAALPEMPPAT
jgi:acetoin utilization protein AcuB